VAVQVTIRAAVEKLKVSIGIYIEQMGFRFAACRKTVIRDYA
jgi:hypothetical protein